MSNTSINDLVMAYELAAKGNPDAASKMLSIFGQLSDDAADKIEALATRIAELEAQVGELVNGINENHGLLEAFVKDLCDDKLPMPKVTAGIMLITADGIKDKALANINKEEK